MIFINEYDVSDIIAATSAFIVIVGGIFAFIKWKKPSIFKELNILMN